MTAATPPRIAAASKPSGKGAKILANYAQIAVLLAYRAGLRLGEIVKLRLRDIERSRDQWLFIVDNRFGTNKSHASRRQIPFAVLLSEQEQEKFAHFLKGRRERGSGDHALFEDPKTGNPLNAGWLSQIVSDALNEVLGDSRWTFHHLRHAAANNLFLAIEEETDLCARLAGWSDSQCCEIRRKILPNPAARQSRYLAFAAFMGHADPRQTFESYVHLIEPLLAQRRARQPIVQDINLYAAALDVAPDRLSHLKTDGDVARMLSTNLKDHIAKTAAKALVKSAKQQPAPKPRAASAPTVGDCRRTLKIVELGGSFLAAAEEAGIEIATVERWVASARKLAALKTKYGASRLFSAARLERAAAGQSIDGRPIVPSKKELFLPSDPKSSVDWDDCDQLFDHFQGMSESEHGKGELEFAIAHVIGKFDTSNSGVAFRSPEALDRFLQLFAGSHIAGTRWHLQLRLATGGLIAPWVEHLPKGSTYSERPTKNVGEKPSHKHPQQANGHVRLHLRRPS